MSQELLKVLVYGYWGTAYDTNPGKENLLTVPFNFAKTLFSCAWITGFSPSVASPSCLMRFIWLALYWSILSSYISSLHAATWCNSLLYQINTCRPCLSSNLVDVSLIQSFYHSILHCGYFRHYFLKVLVSILHGYALVTGNKLNELVNIWYV